MDFKSPIDIIFSPDLVRASFNAVLFTKNSGALNKASEGLSALNPFGIIGALKIPLTICSASKSVRSLPASFALALNKFFAFSTAWAAGLYLKKGPIPFSWNISYVLLI